MEHRSRSTLPCASPSTTSQLNGPLHRTTALADLTISVGRRMVKPRVSRARRTIKGVGGLRPGKCGDATGDGRALNDGQVAVGAHGFHGFIAAFCIDLLEDAMNVVSHGELREVQVGGNFFVGESLGHEPYQLLLAEG
jgi:hypothetical protein